MWIETDNEATRRLYNDELMDGPVEFNENGRARVTSDVGERLIEHYDGIREYEAASDSDSDSNTDTEDNQ